MKSTGKLISEVAQRTRYLKAPVTEIIQALEDIINESVINGETAKFACVETGAKNIPAREGFTPKGKYYNTEAHTLPYAKVRPAFKKKYMELTSKK